jgi:hypothetical protein
VWDTQNAVAANLDARAARTGPGNRVSRSLLSVTMRRGAKEPTLEKPCKRLRKSRRQKKSDSGDGKRIATLAPKVVAGRGDDADAEIFSEGRERQKLLRIGEALREVGFDERAFARICKRQLQRLLKIDKPSAADKSLADLLKEIGRFLEPGGSVPASAPVADLPAVVQLIHDIPRPVRTRPDTDGYIPAEREAF